MLPILLFFGGFKMKCDFCDKEINKDFYITEFGYFICPTCNDDYKGTLYFKNKKQAINYFINYKKCIKKISNEKQKETILNACDDFIKKIQNIEGD